MTARRSPMWTGSRYICGIAPRPEDVSVWDVCRNLSRIRRYSGATIAPFTVGQHTLLGLHYARQHGEPPAILAHFLLHDAPEAYIGDVPAPVKRSLPGYQEREARFLSAIYATCGAPDPTPAQAAVVAEYDMLACASEKAVLISPAAGPWEGMPEPLAVPDAILHAPEEAVRRALLGAFRAWFAIPGIQVRLGDETDQGAARLGELIGLG